jgi:hypothetical protein
MGMVNSVSTAVHRMDSVTEEAEELDCILAGILVEIDMVVDMYLERDMVFVGIVVIEDLGKILRTLGMDVVDLNMAGDLPFW